MVVAGSNLFGDSDSNPPANGRGTNGRRGKSRHTIPSDFAAGRDIQKQILQDLEKNGFRGHNFFAINLALEEALTNAIRHGNQLDPSKKVRVEWQVTPQRAEIVIEDEGSGFKRDSVPDPTCEANLEKCSGRGILLIESYMSRVTWDRGGRRVRMIKVKEPEPT